MTRYTNLCHDMRRKRRKQSITENRRKWCKIKENQYFQGVLRHDKNIICLPWQYLPQHNGRERFNRHGRQAWRIITI